MGKHDKNKSKEHKAENGGRALDDVDPPIVGAKNEGTEDVITENVDREVDPSATRALPVKASADLKAEFLGAFQTIVDAKATIARAKTEAAKLASEIGERMAAKNLTSIDIGGEKWRSRRAKGGAGWTLHREKEDAGGDLD